jgi:hypothetical protein
MLRSLSILLAFLFLGCTVNRTSWKPAEEPPIVRQELVFDAVVYGCSPPEGGKVDVLLTSDEGNGGKILFRNALLRKVQEKSQSDTSRNRNQSEIKLFTVEIIVTAGEAEKYQSLYPENSIPSIYITHSNETGKIGRDPARYKRKSS